MKLAECNGMISKSGLKILEIENGLEDKEMFWLKELGDFIECGTRSSQTIVFCYRRNLDERDFIFDREDMEDELENDSDDQLDENESDLDGTDLLEINKGLTKFRQRLGEAVYMEYYIFYMGKTVAFRKMADWYDEFHSQIDDARLKLIRTFSERNRQEYDAAAKKKELCYNKINQLQNNDDFRKLVLRKNTTLRIISQYIIQVVPEAAELSPNALKNKAQEMKDNILAVRAFENKKQ